MNTLPSGWERKKLGDLFEFKNGLNTDKSQYGKGTKFVNVMDIFNNTLLTENNILGRVTISEKQFEENKLNYGDILFNRTSEIFDEIAMAAVYMDCKPAVFGGFVIRARAIKNVFDAVYSSYGFQSDFFRNQVVKLGQGAIRANIGQKDLAKVNILIPPLSEQTKIVNILSTWDKAIQTTEQLLANSQQQKKALMQQLLTGKKRLKGFSGEWREIKLSDLCSITTGKKDVNEGNPTGLYPFFTCAKECTYSDAYSFDGEALLIAGNGVIGTTHYYVGKFEAYQRTYVLQDFRNIYTHFLHQYILFFLEKNIEREKQHGAMPYIKVGLLNNFIVTVPLWEEQQKIAQILSTQDHEIDTLQQKLTCLKQEKKALMQKLLSGKVRVA